MALFKNFVDFFKLSDDDDFDMDDYDDYRAAQEEKERKKEEKSKKKEEERTRRLLELEEEEEDLMDSPKRPFSGRMSSRNSKQTVTEPAQRASAPKAETKAPRTTFRFASQNQTETNAAVSSARPSRPAPVRLNNRNTGRELNVIKPVHFEDSQDICDSLLEGRPVIVNLENFDLDMGQRIMDFVCGCLYSIDGKLHQISGYIFIVSPNDVDISGDYLALMQQDGFGVPTLNRNL